MRTLIIGSPGVGKTYLTRQLQERRQVAVLHLDKIWHDMDYSEEAEKVFEERLKAFMSASDDWIIDGNFASTLPLRLQYAQQVIWLKSSPWACLYNVLKRSLLSWCRVSKREEMPAAFKERLDKDYVDFFRFVW